MKLIVGQQRSISELMKTCGPGRVAEDETGEDAAADDAPQFRQVDLDDLVQFAAVGIYGPGAVGVTDQSPDLQPVGIVRPVVTAQSAEQITSCQIRNY